MSFSSRTRGDKKRQKSLDIFFGYHKIEAPKSDSLGLRRSLVDNERHTSNSSSSHGCDSQSSYQSWSCCCVCSQLLLRNSDNLHCVLDSNVFGGRVARPAEETAVFFPLFSLDGFWLLTCLIGLLILKFLVTMRLFDIGKLRALCLMIAITGLITLTARVLTSGLKLFIKA